MKGQRFLLLSSSAIAAFAVYMIVISFDPHTMPLRMRTLFYVALFWTIAGSLSLIWLVVAGAVTNSLKHRVQLYPILRQSSILGTVVIALLMLQALRSLLWWDALLIIVAALLFEMFFRVRIPIRTEKI